MALLGGIGRIKLLGVVVAGVGAMIVFGLWIAAPTNISLSILLMVVFPLFLGAVIYTFGWPIEGFVRLEPSGPVISHQSPAITRSTGRSAQAIY
jgi:hypothetical protein